MVLCLLTTDFTRESSVSLLDLAGASARSLFLLTPTCCRNTNQQQAPAGDDQLAELREIFRSFDRNNDGSLTQLELGSLLRSLGLRPSADQLDALIQRADTNSNGLVEFSEFVALVAPDLLDDRSPYCEDQLGRLFGIFDRDGALLPYIPSRDRMLYFVVVTLYLARIPINLSCGSFWVGSSFSISHFGYLTYHLKIASFISLCLSSSPASSSLIFVVDRFELGHRSPPVISVILRTI